MKKTTLALATLLSTLSFTLLTPTAFADDPPAAADSSSAPADSATTPAADSSTDTTAEPAPEATE